MTKWALKHIQFTVMATILLLIFGIYAYAHMPRSEDPGFIIRTARVSTLFPGASPDRVEMLVTDPIEEAIQEIPELDYVTSESSTGRSIIDVYIREEFTDIRPIWDNLRRKVEDVKPRLPQGIEGPFVNDEFGDIFGTLIALTGEGYSYADLKDIAKMMRDDLLRLPDVAKVQIVGEQEERIYIDYNEARLAEVGLSASQLGDLLRRTNILSPGGYVSNQYERTVVEPSGNFESLDQVKETVLPLPDGGTIFLKDIADVNPGYITPKETFVRYDGQDALIVAVSMQEGGNVIKLGNEIEAITDHFRETYPVGIELEFTAFQPDVVRKIIADFSENLLQAILFVIIMMLLTLGLRTGLLVASLIPCAVFVSFVVMNFMGITLDQISLAALVIALGLFVDNAIVFNESFMVELEAGQEPKEAALMTAKQLKMPLLIASLTTSAAFLPIYLAKSAAGEYTQSLFEVVTIALLASWFYSMTMSPLMAMRFLKVRKRKEGGIMERINKGYVALLKRCLTHRRSTAWISVGLFALACAGLGLVPKIFFPQNARPIVAMEIEVPNGSPIERTEGAVIEIEKYLETQNEVIDWAAFVGSPGPRYYLSYSPEMAKPEYAYILVNTLDDHAAEKLIEDFDLQIMDTSVRLRRLSYGMPIQYPIELRISGRDYTELRRIADEIEAKLSTISGVTNTNDDWGPQTKKLYVDVDQNAALRSGISSVDVANSLQTYLTGFKIDQFRREEDLLPVILRSDEPDRESASRLPGLSVYSQGQDRTVVPLQQVAKLETKWQPARIKRRDTLKTIKIRSDLKSGYTVGPVLDEIVPWLQEQEEQWPSGFFYAVGGEREESAKAEKSIYAGIPAAVLAILLLLMLQFNCVKRATIVLLTIPMGLVGVTIGLLVTYTALGFITFLGIVALSGIVINNGIVMIDRIDTEIEAGKGPYDAILEACRRRLRPILLSAGTTIIGMIPLIYGGGPMFSPMAIAIVSGLIFATFLSLLVTPVLYALFFHVAKH